MLDNIRITLERLRRFRAGNAARYKDYMFSAIKGIKTITEESIEAGVASGLAVDIREYFEDDRHYRAWKKLLSRFAKKGKHRELAATFLQFMRNLRAGRSTAPSKQATASAEEVAASSAEEAPEVPDVLNEETLPTIQQAAIKEARNLGSFVWTDRRLDEAYAWQFELVRRQQQVHLRSEAQRMLTVFLSCERNTLQETTKTKVLPCRT